MGKKPSAINLLVADPQMCMSLEDLSLSVMSQNKCSSNDIMAKALTDINSTSLNRTRFLLIKLEVLKESNGPDFLLLCPDHLLLLN